ncbi:hypothetical protein TA3x_003744 [Tundrisphaera sp. TA3]|uniref:hypothetical protein n=1 Tax=Tundrisphaera sp. TA3 TaxID=3435775 RepID=UPI003EB7D05E
MKRAIFRSCLGVLAVSAGCSTPSKQAGPAKPPEDPTAWSAPAVTREDSGGGSMGGGGGGGFFKSTRLRGAMSSEGADIERSLGVN